MLTFHHSFSTRIFPAAAAEPRYRATSANLGGAKDPAGRRVSQWLLRPAQGDPLRGTLDTRSSKPGGAHAR